jgi:heptosyltransferase-2
MSAFTTILPDRNGTEIKDTRYLSDLGKGRGMRRIGVLNTAFLGDAVLTLPLLQSLRLRYPSAVIDFYVRGGLKSLFCSHPDITEVFEYDKHGDQKGIAGFLALRRDIASRRYELWISAHTSMRSGLLALASGAPLRIGYNRPFLNALYYNRLVKRRFTELDEIERLLELLRPLGADGPLSNWPELSFMEEDQRAADCFFADLQGPVLGVHPGSVWATKRWPADAFAYVAGSALRAGAAVLLFGGPGEESIALQVKTLILAEHGDRAITRVHDCSGSLSLSLLAAYISRLSCYLTNDSGPMHIAWSRRAPVTAVFGPTVRSLGFFPRGAASTVFEANVECRPCGLHGPSSCPLGHHHCMIKVEPEAVWQDVRAKLFP